MHHRNGGYAGTNASSLRCVHIPRVFGAELGDEGGVPVGELGVAVVDDVVDECAHVVAVNIFAGTGFVRVGYAGDGFRLAVAEDAAYREIEAHAVCRDKEAEGFFAGTVGVGDVAGDAVGADLVEDTDDAESETVRVVAEYVGGDFVDVASELDDTLGEASVGADFVDACVDDSVVAYLDERFRAVAVPYVDFLSVAEAAPGLVHIDASDAARFRDGDVIH